MYQHISKSDDKVDMSMILVVLPYFKEKGTESPIARKYEIGGKANFLNHYDIFFSSICKKTSLTPYLGQKHKNKHCFKVI